MPNLKSPWRAIQCIASHYIILHHTVSYYTLTAVTGKQQSKICLTAVFLIISVVLPTPLPNKIIFIVHGDKRNHPAITLSCSFTWPSVVKILSPHTKPSYNHSERNNAPKLCTTLLFIMSILTPGVKESPVTQQCQRDTEYVSINKHTHRGYRCLYEIGSYQIGAVVTCWLLLWHPFTEPYSDRDFTTTEMTLNQLPYKIL